MNRITLLITLAALTISSCNSKEIKMKAGIKSTLACSDECKAINKTSELACKLTTPELEKRKETVIAGLKEQMIEKRELKNGYAFKFPGTDKMVDELAEFIKTERECCDFFTFNLSISGDKSEAWLELTGAEGTKDFISTELGF